MKPHQRQYYKEIITKIRGRIEKLEERISKGKALGADNKGHKYHQKYLDLLNELEREKSYETDYLNSWKKKTGKSFDDYFDSVYEMAKSMDWTK